MRRTARSPQDEAGSKPSRQVSRSPSEGPVGSQTTAPGVCEGTSRSSAPPPKAAVSPRQARRPRIPIRTLSPSLPVWVALALLWSSAGWCLRVGFPNEPPRAPRSDEQRISYLVDPASSHMLVSKIKPCMSKYRPKQGETANGSLNQLWFIGSYPFLLG